MKGQHAAALESLAEGADAGASEVGDYVVLYRAKANLMLDRGEQALELFRLSRVRYPDSSRLQEAILGECQALLQLHRPSAVLSALQNPMLQESAESLRCRARALEDSGNRGEAISVYLRILAKYANSKEVAFAEQRLAVLSPKYWARPANYRTLLERAENLLRSGRNRDARALLARLGPVRAPDVAAGVKRTILFAQAEYNLGKALGVLPVVKRVPASLPDLQAQAIYLEAACNRRLGRESSFLETRDRALHIYPRSSFTEKILYSAATYFETNGRLAEAREAYSTLLTRFPKGEYAERAGMRSALFSYFLKRYEEALRGFRDYLISYPGLRTPLILYWMGRCCERLGDPISAIELLKGTQALAGDSYYGGRAMAALGALKHAADASSRLSPAIDFVEIRRRIEARRNEDFAIAPPSAEVGRIIERARQLASVNLLDLGLDELRWGIRRFPDDRAIKYVMSRLYEIKGDYVGVIVTLRRAFPEYETRPRNMIPQQVWDMLYPVHHRDVIGAQASNLNLDPNLVLGLIRQESAFVAEARSAANARGLMQVLPSTGRKLAREARLPRYTVQKLFQPDVNIALGTRHLATLLRHFDGRVELALAAYNAGDDRVDRWMQEFGNLEMAEFVELIPFSETRDYIKQVLTNATFYRRLASSSAGASEGERLPKIHRQNYAKIG